MAYILNIDTATEIAYVGISENEKILASESNENQMTHASFVQPSIERIVKKLSLPLESIDAVAVSAGPGSYTGLRVGMASAKGICFALQKPLILVNTLEIIATAAIRERRNESAAFHFCPMIDARRMEVYAAFYDEQLHSIIEPTAIILSENSFLEYLNAQKVVFSGSGSAKFFKILNHPNAVFSSQKHTVCDVASLSARLFHKKSFSNLAYSEPFYLKEFFSQNS